MKKRRGPAKTKLTRHSKARLINPSRRAGIALLTALIAVFVGFGLYVRLSSQAAIGAPYINGAQLKFSDGSRFVVKGASLFTMPHSDSFTVGYFNTMYNNRDQIMARMKAQGINTVRLTVVTDTGVYSAAGGYTAYLQKIADLVGAANHAGLYVVICQWSSLYDKSAWPSKYASELPLFRDIYARLGAKPMVMYEPFNEPNNLTWAQWRTPMQEVIKYFRSTIHYPGVLMIDTINWSNDFSPTETQNLLNLDASLSSTHKSNLLIANHRYANDHTCFCGTEKTNWTNGVGQYASSYPIIGTEYGFYDGASFANNPQWAKDFLGYLAGTSVPGGFNGAMIFTWYWSDTNSLTTGDHLTLSTSGNIAKSYYYDRLPGYAGPTNTPTPTPKTPTPIPKTPTPAPPATKTPTPAATPAKTPTPSPAADPHSTATTPPAAGGKPAPTPLPVLLVANPVTAGTNPGSASTAPSPAIPQNIPVVQGTLRLTSPSGGEVVQVDVDGHKVATSSILDTTYLSNQQHTIVLSSKGSDGAILKTQQTVRVDNHLSFWQFSRNLLFAGFHGNKANITTAQIIIVAALIITIGAAIFIQIWNRRLARSYTM